MTHWRKPLYTIETEFGTLYSVDEKDADAIADYLQSGSDPVKFVRHRERVPDIRGITVILVWATLNALVMVLLVSMVTKWLAYLWG